uniref:Uncharacterized protein n=1 Tax=Panagrolaimus davidi TaxID=227884 RepID=A0A914R258_9BILA
MDYWNTKNGEFLFASHWFYECINALKIPTQFCRLPTTCSAVLSNTEHRFKNVTQNVKNSDQRTFHGENLAWYKQINDMKEIGCDYKVFSSWFYYFLFCYITLILSIICCIIITLILTLFSIDKSENQLLDRIHQASENKLQFEINRLEKKAKTLPTQEKEIFLLPFVYSKDLPPPPQTTTTAAPTGLKSLSVEPRK